MYRLFPAKKGALPGQQTSMFKHKTDRIPAESYFCNHICMNTIIS